MGSKYANKSKRVVPVKPDHKAGVPAKTGEELRRIEYAEFCFDLATKGWSQREIAVSLAENYMLPTVPTHVYIGTLIREAVKYRSERVEEMRENYLAVAIPRLEQIVRQFLPIAAGTGPRYVLRRKVYKDEVVEVIDEEAFEESRKAAEVVLKVTEQARKLLGIGLVEEGGDGQPLSGQQMNTLIINTVNQTYVGNGAQKTIGALMIGSGDDAIDALEATGGGI